MLKKYSFSDYAERLERAGLLKSREGTAGVIEAFCCDPGKASEGSLFVCKGNNSANIFARPPARAPIFR